MSVRKRSWTTPKGVEKTAWVVDYADTTGKRRLKTFRLKKEADAFAATASVEVREGVHVPDRETVTVEVAGTKWLETCRAAKLEPTTIDQYRQHLDFHIVPFIGKTLLSKITVPSVRSLQDQLREEGRAPAMVKRVTTSLGSLLSDAQERGLVTRNAVREMSKGRARGVASRGERRQKARLQVGKDIPTREEIRKIVDRLKPAWRPLIITAIFSGMRASELRGLRWSDVDLEEAKIHVRQRADRYRTIGMPKSDAGQRTIPVPPVVVNTLKEWKKAAPKSNLDLVFPTQDGGVVWHQALVKQALWPPQIAAGVTVAGVKKDRNGKPVLDDEGKPVEAPAPKYPGLHALRHFFASWCINRRADGGLELPPKAVQERMGHSSIVMTMDTYGHLFPAGDESEMLAEAERSLLGAASDATRMQHGDTAKNAQQS